MTKRIVQIEIEYEGEHCSKDCPSISETDEGPYCSIHKGFIGIDRSIGNEFGLLRMPECKAEDAQPVPAFPFTPEQRKIFDEAVKEIDKAFERAKQSRDYLLLDKDCPKCGPQCPYR